MGKVKIVITGGGTAGHTNPGIAVAQALVEKGLDPSEIHFIGAKRGNEGTLVPEAGFTISLLPGRGVKRQLSLSSLKAIVALKFAAFKALYLMLRLRPKAVMCLGGYAAFPASLAAVLLRRPLIVSEQNARSSAVNRLFGKFAKKCALPFPDTDLPKGLLTGNPIRSSITAASDEQRRAARQKLGVAAGDSRTIVAVWSGSLGAISVNKAVKELTSLWADRSDLFVYHVVGKRDWDSFKQSESRPADGLWYQTVAYESDMPTLLAGADVAICRAGASTISELSVAGLPSVLIPLPGAPRDHQRANAQELKDVGGAVLLKDSELTGEKLQQTLAPILESQAKRDEMSQAAKSVARPNAAAAVADLLLAFADDAKGTN